MKQFKFNEQAALEQMVKANFIDINNITNTIYSLAKYNYYVLGLEDEDNYQQILKYVQKNCEHIFEEGIYEDIINCIKNVKKHKMASIDEVCITKSELDVIRSLNDIKQEKAIFVILAVSKYFNALNGKEYDAAFLSNSDICKMARISIPVKERDVFMQFAYDKELLYRHTWCDSTIKKVTFVSHNEEDAVVLRLNEGDFKDLAYTYLAYTTPHQFRKCVRCGKWMRKNKADKRICTECSKVSGSSEEKDEFKTVHCVDCGSPVYVSVLNTKTCRCNECQSNRDIYLNRESSRERMKKYREND